MPDPQNLRELGERLDEAQRRQQAARSRPAPSQMGIAFRLSTELVVALVLGGAMGWGIDWLFGYFGIHTKPLFLIVFFMVGAGAGFVGVMRAAKTINADIAAKASAPSVNDDEES